MDNSRKQPFIFISSTCYDLKQVKEDLKEFFDNSYGFDTMYKYLRIVAG